MRIRHVFISILFFLMPAIVVLSAGSALAGVAGPLFGNGDFETGDLSNWQWCGDAGAADFNVINGSYSAYITTGADSYNDLCTWLDSSYMYPEFETSLIRASFKVRYKTDEIPGEPVYEDPFTAVLAVSPGVAVQMVSIETDGITPGPNTTVKKTLHTTSTITH
ncbi:MAG: hypothetical protein L0956_07220, partial [Candidatus Mariimomonas ferrooxydans]